MVSDELLTFIEKLIERKVSHEQIKSLLMKKGGWEADDIDQAFVELEKKSKNTSDSQEQSRRKVMYESPLVGTLIRPDDEGGEVELNTNTKKASSPKTMGTHTSEEPLKREKEKKTEQLTASQKAERVHGGEQEERQVETKETSSSKKTSLPAQSTNTAQTDAVPQTPPEVTEAAAQAEKSLRDRQLKKRVISVAFLLIVTSLIGGVLAYYFLGRSLSASEVFEQALKESHKVYSATNAGMLAATISWDNNTTSTDIAKETTLQFDVDYNFTYDTSQTVNPIGEGVVQLTLGGLAADVPVQMGAIIDAKLIDHTLYVRFNKVQNIPLPKAVLDLRRTWIAIDLDSFASILETNLNDVLVERERLSKEAAIESEKIFEDQSFRAFIDRIFVQRDDSAVDGVPVYTFALTLTDSDIIYIKNAASEFIDLYGSEMITGNIESDTLSTAIRTGEMDPLFVNLKDAAVTIAIGKSDLLPRQLTVISAGRGIPLLGTKIAYGLEIDHTTYDYNEPVLVQINGDMVTFDSLLEQMRLIPVIVIPAQSTSTQDDEAFTQINL